MKKQDKKGGGNGGGEKQEKPKESTPKQSSEPAPNKETESKSAEPTYTTRTQQLNLRDVLNPDIRSRKESKTIISNANQAFNKMWKQGSGYTEANNLNGHLSNKVSSLNKLVERTFKDGNADAVWKKMQDGTYLPDDETRKFRYGR